MPTFTFSCACGWQGDVRTTFDQNNVSCPSCEATAHKESVYSINFGGFVRTPPGERDYRQSFKDYTEATAELGYREESLSKTEGKLIQAPSLFKEAKRKARELTKKGVKDAGDLS